MKKLTILIMCMVMILQFRVSGSNPNDSLMVIYKLINSKMDLFENQLNQHSVEFEKINQSILKQESRLDSQVSMLDSAFDGVSSQLSASSFLVAVFTIIITVIGVGVGIYFTRIEKNVREMKIDNELLLQKNINIKKEMEDLSKKITHDRNGLYTIIRNEESNHIIKRLNDVPEDIVNLISLLTSRELEESHFIKIKEAFIQVDDDPEYKAPFLLIFYQHFAGQTFLDPDLSPSFLNSLQTNMNSSFKNDIVKSTKDFFMVVYNRGISNYVIDINHYVSELGMCKYNEYEELYFAIFNIIAERSIRFELYSIIEKKDSTLPFRKQYGRLLTDYKKDNPSDLEKTIISEVEQIS